MQTRNILDVRTIVVVVSLVAFVSLAVWSIGFGLTSTQSLQNQVDDLMAQKNSLQAQVTSLQNQAASLNTQLSEKQKGIENLEALATAYGGDVAKFFERFTPS